MLNITRFPAVALCLLAALFFASVGCEQKREVLDINTPDGSLEVNETEEGIEIDLDEEN